MPSKSPAQHRLMQAVADDPAFARKAGIPQSVGREFAQADRRLKAHRDAVKGGHKAPVSHAEFERLGR